MICWKCNIDKPIEDYYRDKNVPCGHKRKCKKCYNEYSLGLPSRKKYDKVNKDYIYARHKKYRERPEVKERILTKKKEWRDKNKERNRAYDSEYKKQKSIIDINYRIARIFRSNLTARLRKSKVSKPKTIELIGCDISFLKKHLESNFKDGMSWSNYGRYGWHIDHIKPCSKFDLSNKEEQKKCFNYTNLQPLWWLDNIKKSNKYEENMCS